MCIWWDLRRVCSRTKGAAPSPLPFGCHGFGELEKARASDLSRPWQWWRWLHYLLCIQRPCRVWTAVTVWGDFKRWLWTCRESSVAVGMQGRQWTPALPTPGGEVAIATLPSCTRPSSQILLLPSCTQLTCSSPSSSSSPSYSSSSQADWLLGPLLPVFLWAISSMQVGDCRLSKQGFLEGWRKGDSSPGLQKDNLLCLQN